MLFAVLLDFANISFCRGEIVLGVCFWCSWSSDLLKLASQSCRRCVCCLCLVWSFQNDPFLLLLLFYLTPLLPTRREISELLPCRQCLYILSQLRPQMLLFGTCPVIICCLDCLDSTSKYQPSSAHITHLGCSFLSSIISTP